MMIVCFDHVMLLVVADMVLKPVHGNAWELATMAALLAIGTELTLIPGMKRQPAAA